MLPDIPVNLWGRDVLDDMGAVLTTQPIQQMLKSQGYCPDKGLGKMLQGDPLPAADKNYVTRGPGDTKGLGSFP